MSLRSYQSSAHSKAAPSQTYAEKKNQALKAKNTAVLSFDELERIKSMCSQTTNGEDYTTMRDNQRQTLQEISNSRVKQWPNTMNALREKKESDRIQKLEEAEIERRKIDAKEEEYQQQLRQNQLDRANKMFHDNEDKVKALHSKMLMCDVITEQQAQLSLKGRKQKLEKEIDLQWEELEKQKMAEYDERLREKLEKEYHKKMKNAQNVSEQLETFKLNYIKKMKEEELEGELIKRQVEEDLEREKQKDLERQKKVAKTREDFRTANEELLKIQAAIALKEKEEEARIIEHAKKRDAMEHLKKTKEEERFKTKQAIKQQLIDRQIAELMKVRDQQEEMLNKQVAEAENKAADEFEKKERRKAEMKSAIEKSRAAQLEKKRQEDEAKKGEEREFSEFWKLRNEELAIADAQEKEEHRQRAAELTAYIRKQAEDKNRKAQEDFINEQHAAMRNNALMDQQEKNFYSYAEKCIAEWSSQGKNVKPLIMELKNYKKRVA